MWAVLMRIVVLEAGDVNREIRVLFRLQSRLNAIHPHTCISHFQC